MVSSVEMKPILEESIRKLEKWVEEHNYKGYEPFDGLSSFLKPFTFGNLFLERLLQQVIRQNPVNLRPLLGVKPQESTKGRGYMAWGYLNMYNLTRDNTYKDKAFLCLDWLDRNKAPGYVYHSWGNHFHYASRGGRVAKYEPTIVWTGLIGQVFLDAYDLFRKDEHLDIIRSISNWILQLPREKTSKGICLSYVSFEQDSIHNSNMHGAAFLAKAARYGQNNSSLEVARRAMEYSCSQQRPDASWYYGEDPKHHWIDNFHTGYNLDSLKRYIDTTGDRQFEETMMRGYKFFKEHFFDGTGKPKYYYNKTYPIDIQCASQSIDTLTFFSDHDQEALALACKVANWTIDNMQDRDGHFYYRIYPFGIKSKASMIHWGQATTYKALTSLLLRLN